VSYRKTRERDLPPEGEVWSDDETDPSRFFGEGRRSRKADWKALQLCKQVERSVAVTLLGQCESEALVGAVVAAVEPAPDSGRLRLTVVLAPERVAGDLSAAWTALQRATGVFREEVARSVHRKRVPEIVFEVRLSEEVGRG
jgi:ribosome-binding factor A